MDSTMFNQQFGQIYARDGTILFILHELQIIFCWQQKLYVAPPHERHLS